jgi:predicted HD superfamily hydrolase involved in NAD metabolism
MAFTPESAVALLQARLSPARRFHSLGAAGFAALLCVRHGLDPEKGHLAGLVHDLARELPAAELLGLAGGGGFLPWERAAPVLLHGRAAAVLLRDRYGLSDAEVLTAVADHVTGRPRMPRLSKVLFCADFLEPGRDFADDALRALALELSLEAATALVLEKVFAFLRRRGMWIAPPALDLYEELGGDVAKKT